MNETKLNKLDSKIWKDVDQLILFGYGRQGKKMFVKLKEDFVIHGIIENDTGKIGAKVDDITIQGVETLGALPGKCKIVITTSEHYYQGIKLQLEQLGFREYIDFVMYQQFIMEWYYKFKEKIYLVKTDLCVTTYCNLNCRHCIEFLPYFKERKHTNAEECKQSLDDYFGCVDYCMEMDIIGGEPFIYGDLETVISYMGRNYRDKIGYAGIITNGLVLPTDNVLKAINEYNFTVSLSDYSLDDHYNKRFTDTVKKLDEYGVDYFINSDIDWFDFGFPENKYNYDDSDVAKHMENCNNIEHCVDNSKLFFCGLEWAAQKGGLTVPEKKNYIDLSEFQNTSFEERKQILELILGNIPGGYLEFCRHCGGFGIDNDNMVPTAKQM